MDRIKCARALPSGENACEKEGNVSCSQCRLVNYCSKECQKQHWSKHKKDCKSEYMNSNWQPRWAIEQRKPAFVTTDGASVPFNQMGIYPWGNVFARDILNLKRNEGTVPSRNKDFNIAFVAYKNLWDMLKTVNGLPSDYAGRCRILLNDDSENPMMRSAVAWRNMLVLLILGGALPGSAADNAELATHLIYSAALRGPDGARLRMFAVALLHDITAQLRAGRVAYEVHRDVGQAGHIHASLAIQDVLPLIQTFKGDVSWQSAKASRQSVTLAPARVDYRERRMTGLTPSHRVAHMRYRETGILLPFGESIAPFVEPNRLLFSPNGHWMIRDSADPMEGWDPRDFIPAGIRHGCREEDVYGCLYYYVKDELMKFADRLQTQRIEIHVTVRDLCELGQALQSGELGGSSLSAFRGARFDRIDTANTCDYGELKHIVRAWGPLLNRDNANTALSAYSMNWIKTGEYGAEGLMKAAKRDNNKVPELMKVNVRAAEFQGIDIRAPMMQELNNPTLLRFMHQIEMFYDNTRDFRTWIAPQLGHLEAASLQLRHRNKIISKRIGFDMDEKSKNLPPLSQRDFYWLTQLSDVFGLDRFFEFEPMERLGDDSLELD